MASIARTFRRPLGPSVSESLNRGSSTQQATLAILKDLIAKKTSLDNIIALMGTGAKASGSIVCPDLTDLIGNDGLYLTIPDGINEAVKVEPRAKAKTLLTLVSLATMQDNDTLVLDDGDNPATTLEAQKSVTAAAATGLITCVAKALLKNNQYLLIDDGTNPATGFRLNVAAAAAATGNVAWVAKSLLRNNQYVRIGDGTNPVVVFKLNVEAAAKATGSITCVAKANLIDGETVTYAGVTFEFDLTGDGVTEGNVQVDVSQCVTAMDVAIVLAAAINNSSLTISATDITADVITLEADTQSYTHNSVIETTVVDGGFGVTGMTGGVTPFDGTGAEEVDITGDTTAAQIATTFYGVVNGVVAGLTITATEPSDENVPLTADSQDYDHNVTIESDIDAVGFAVTGMTGGVTAFSADGYNEVDLLAASTDVEVATALKAEIDTIVASFDITTGALVGAGVPLTNDGVGAVGNVAIETDIDAVGFSAAGMSGGVDGFEATGGGVVVVDLTGAGTDEEAAQAYADTINAVGAGLALSAGDADGLDILLTGKTTGAKTVSVTGDVVDTTDEVSAGLGGVAVVGASELDLTDAETGALHAAALQALLEGLGTETLALTATVADDTVSLEKLVVGVAGDVDITQTGGDVYELDGMSGGLDAMDPHQVNLAKLAANADALLALL